MENKKYVPNDVWKFRINLKNNYVEQTIYTQPFPDFPLGEYKSAEQVQKFYDDQEDLVQEKYFTKEDDGLTKNWSGERVFCNPPYGREIPYWVKKCYEENKLNNTFIVMLIPARTDTSYFHDYIYNKQEIRFIRGRLKFNDGKNPAPFPSMVVIFR